MYKTLYPITHYYVDGGDINTDYTLRIFMDDDIYKEFKKEISPNSVVTIIDRCMFDIYGMPLNVWKIISAEPFNNKKEWIIYCDRRIKEDFTNGIYAGKQIIVNNKYIKVIKE